MIEHAEAGRTGERLVAIHQDKVDARGREVGRDASAKPEAIRCLTAFGPANGSAGRTRSAVVSEVPEAMRLVAMSAVPGETADVLNSGDI